MLGKVHMLFLFEWNYYLGFMNYWFIPNAFLEAAKAGFTPQRRNIV